MAPTRSANRLNFLDVKRRHCNIFCFFQAGRFTSKKTNQSASVGHVITQAASLIVLLIFWRAAQCLSTVASRQTAANRRLYAS